MRMMTVRATARALGVHENTIRRWEQHGILRAVRLPGSGFRRFSEDQVNDLARAMHASVIGYPSDPGLAEDRFVSGVYDESLAEQD